MTPCRFPAPLCLRLVCDVPLVQLALMQTLGDLPGVQLSVDPDLTACCASLRQRPDQLVVLWLGRPGRCGTLDAAAMLRRAAPAAGLFVYPDEEECASLEDYLPLRVEALLRRRDPVEVLLTAFSRVRYGGHWISPGLGVALPASWSAHAGCA